jgi:hypothetical protein
VATRTLPRWLPAVNRLVRLLQRLGLQLGTIHVLTVPGRTSGAPRPTPISPLTVDGRRYVIAALPQADWARNARAAGIGELAYGRRRRQVTLTEITDPDLRRTVMRAFPTEVPHGVPFFVRLGLVKGGDRVAVFELTDSA